MKKNLKLGALVALLVVGVGVSKVFASSENSAGGASVVDRVNMLNGSFKMDVLKDVGYKHFYVTNDTVVQLLLDENGRAVTDGLVHSVCVGVGEAAGNSAILWDSSVATDNAVTSTTKRLALAFPRSATVAVCIVIDAQFSRGVAIYNGTLVGETHVYYRPIGGRN